MMNTQRRPALGLVSGATLGWVFQSVNLMDRQEGDEPTPREKMQGIIANAAVRGTPGVDLLSLAARRPLTGCP